METTPPQSYTNTLKYAMSVNISDSQFSHIAKLSHLEIKPEEKYIKNQLSQAADYVAILNELDTKEIL